MTIPLLTDDDLSNSLDMNTAIDVMQQAFEKQFSGALQAPARVSIDLGVGNLVLTAGAATDEQACIGFRVYDLKQLKSPKRDELVTVFDTQSGALKGLVVGPLLGAIRTGAIGGVAIKHLSRPGATTLGILGTGVQARTQLQAAVAVRQFTEINVFSRSKQNLAAFADEMSRSTGCEIKQCDSAREVVESADVLICATTSGEPLLSADWLKPGVHINNVGPKFKQSRELDLDVIERAALLATDSLAQVEAFGDEFILHDTEHRARLIELSEIIGGRHTGRQSETDVSLFISLGLAGTEVLLADRLIEMSQQS